MFIGHFAVGFAAKKYAPRTSLAILLAAPLLPDLLWPPLLLLGWEKVRLAPGITRMTPLDFVWYPWSHSLLLDGVWAAVFAFLYYRLSRYRPGAFAIVAGVLSHWVLDWITHTADMPLYPGGPRFGLGLWNTVAGTVAVEVIMFAVGIWMYAAATRARDSIGRYAFAAYVVVLMATYLNDSFGSEPSTLSVKADIAWPGLVAGFIMLLWAWWFDRHRIAQS